MKVSVQAYRLETELTRNGTLTFEDLPFVAGDTVEVIVLAQSRSNHGDEAYPLRGLPLEYDRPFEGAATDDWHATR